jgi:phenylacetate 2-hydroxylase
MYKERRNKYMADLMQELRSDIRNDVDIPCSMGKILRDETARFNESRHALTTGSLQATYTNCSAELRSLSITLLSAGLDTIPANLVQGLAILSSEIGQDIQQKIYDAIIDTYGSTEGAWDALAKEETVSYLKSFVQEVLRYFSVVPMGFPRTNNDPITIGDARIPTGTWFYMNVKSANFDPLHYSEPNVFNPERFLTAGKSGDGPQAGHYSYGAGRRACIGFHLANRLMYVMFGRMVLAWFIIAVELVDTNPSTYNLCKTSLVAEPKDFE